MKHRSIVLGNGWPVPAGLTPARRRRARFAVAALPLALIAVLGSTVSSSAGLASPRAFPDADVTFTGHGLGSGYGMGQWGAFGYATIYHWTYIDILEHFYLNPPVPVTREVLSSAADNDLLRVAIEENANYAMAVTSSSSFTFDTASGSRIVTIPAGEAARAFEPGRSNALPGTWNIETAASCTASSWKVIKAGLTDPVAVPASQSATAPRSGLLTLCGGDGVDVTYRGELEAYDWYGSATGDKHVERTLNLIHLEQYVADVTPGESPGGWGAYGGTAGAPQGEQWGFQELMAQAVAVRTYVLYVASHGGWSGYASICDTDSCQYYERGMEDESSYTTLATTVTAGQYLEQSGTYAPTEYGSSSGGFTETLSYPDGATIFEGVSDEGDRVCIGGPGNLGCNPWHDWTVSIPVATVEQVFPSIGTLESVKVSSTDVSGRVTEIEIVGSKASTSVSGEAFTSDFRGFFSTMFAVTDGPGATDSAKTLEGQHG